MKRRIFFAVLVLSIGSGIACEGLAEQDQDFPWEVFYPAFVQRKPEIIIAEITDTGSPIIAMVTDKHGSETVAVIGEKDQNGNITEITGLLYVSSEGNFFELELDSDGLPVSLTDNAGTKALFSEYTDSTVDITFYDTDNELLGGPVTVAINQDKLSEYLQLFLSIGMPSTPATKLSNTVLGPSSTTPEVGCVSKLLKRQILLVVKGSALVISATACAASIASGMVPGIIIACGSTFHGTLGLLPLAGAEHEAYKIADTVSTTVSIAQCLTGDLTTCATTFAGLVAEKTLRPCNEEIPEGTLSFSFPSRPIDAWLGVGLGGNGGGRVTSDPAGINCPGDCSEIFEYKKEVNLTPIEDTGSIFSGWSGACSGTGDCNIVMDTDKSVTASFSQSESIIYTGSFSGSTTQTYPGFCTWRHDISGTGTATVWGSGTPADPYTATLSFTGTDVITPIPPSFPECQGGMETASGTLDVTINPDGSIEAHGSIGGGTGDFAGSISEDGETVAGTLTIDNPVFDSPIVEEVTLTKQ